MKTLTVLLTLVLLMFSQPLLAEELEVYILPDGTVVDSLEGVNQWIEEEGVAWLKKNFSIEDIPEEPCDEPESKQLPEIQEFNPNGELDTLLYGLLKSREICYHNIQGCDKVGI